MRPFFPYYGSKYRAAIRYGPPRRDEVVEPFAGSACYSVFYEPPRVRLYDRAEAICSLWDWLIHCSLDDVRRIPLAFRDDDEWLALPEGPRNLVFFNTAWGRARLGHKLPGWFTHYHRTGEATGPMVNCRAHNPSGEGSRRLAKSNSVHTFRFWNAAVRELVIRQKPRIAHWSIERKSYAEIDTPEAHYHVDPPYSGKPGRAYECNQIDYDHLAEWVRKLPGTVDVCEYEGADWLPFEPLFAGTTMNTTKKNIEVVWRKNPETLLGMMT